MKINIRRNLFFLVGAIISTLSILSTNAQTLADALDTTNLVWTTGGNAVWFAQTTNTYDGVDAVQSGSVQSNQTSWIETTVVGPATVSFWNFTHLNLPTLFPLTWNFTVNDAAPNQYILALSSTWNEEIYDLGEGTNVLRWTTFGLRPGSEAAFVCLDEFTVAPPRPLAILYQPQGSTNYSGSRVALGVTAVGTPPLRYQWAKDGTNIDDATNAWFAFDQVATNDAGIYSVTVTNSQGSVVSSNALLTVLPPSPPFFTSEPESTTVYTGQSFNWWAAVDGSPPSTAIWQKDGTNFFAETFAGPWGYNPSLTFANISMSDAGIYTLCVSNDYGGVQSSNAVLTVIASVAPVITRQPRSLDVAEGVNTWMTLAATGVPGPYYSWAREGDPPLVSPPGLPPPIQILDPNPQRPFINVAVSNAGIYFATVSNYAGGVISEDALLTVLPAITNVGSCDEDAVGIFVTNGLAFLARGANGLAVLDVSNPASPQLLGSCGTPGYASAVRVSDNLAFVADGSAGLQIFSVTNPSNPALVGGYDPGGYAGDVEVRSNLVYVADGSAGLVILNVSNPAMPLMVGAYVTNISADYVCLAGNDAVFSSPFSEIGLGTNATKSAGLVVVDVSNPALPFETGRLSLGIGHVTSRRQLIFGTTLSGFYAQSLQIITITNPAQPAVIGMFNYYLSTNGVGLLAIAASDVRVVNDLAYLVGNSGGQSQLYVLDVRDPSQPIPVGYYTDASQPTVLAVDGNQAYFAGYESPLEIIKTPFETNPATAPALSVSAQAGINLQIQGRHGLHYDVEYTDQLAGGQWQSLQIILLTNDNAVIQMPAGPAARFFRLRQLD